MPETERELRFPLRVPSGPAPAAEFARLREQSPAARVRLPDGNRAWLITRYDDNVRLFEDPRLSRARAARPGAPRLRGIALESASMTTLDPPEHTRLRRLVAGQFTMRRVAGFRPRIGEIARQLAARLAEAGPPADLVAGYAAPLPMRAICVLLGVPSPDHDWFHAVAEDYLSTDPRTADRARDAAGRLRAYAGELIDRRRREPSDDLLSSLLTARAGDHLTGEELAALVGTLLIAGFQPAMSLVGGSLATLLENPRQLADLRADRSLMTSAVEELLRYVAISVSGGTLRVATHDLGLGGTRIRAGEAVLPATTAANRDPAVFTEPDRLDLRRAPNPHLAFGHGPHRCLGAALARTELAVALETLLDRFPGLRLADSARPPRWHTTGMIRGPVEIWVTW